TTNHQKAMDVAFQRRIRFRINFPAPGVEERERLWKSMLPAEAAVAGEIEWAALARDFNMAGGPSKHAVVHAALHPVADGVPISGELLRLGARLEYEELGRLVSA